MAVTGGLQTHIWNNNLRSILMLALYPIIIMAIIWACAWVLSGNFYHLGSYNAYGDFMPLQPNDFANNVIYSYWPAILAGVSIWFIISYFFHSQMISALAHSHPVRRKEEPELYNMVENLCIAQGMAVPKIYIIESHARNAFASGINEKTYAVTVTRGLMNALQSDELEAVIAHELTHIVNRDVRLLMVTVIFTGMIGFAAQMAWNSIRFNTFYSRGSNNNRSSAVMVIIVIALILWVGYLATLFMRFALSRRREYMADAGAVQMTKNPEAMMRALMRIAGRDQIPHTTGDIMMMCVENRAPFLGLFATHPPIESRIQALSETTNTPVPTLSMPPAEVKHRFQKPGERQNPWLTLERRGR